MNQTRQQLSTIWQHFQSTLFPWLEDVIGPLTAKQQQLIEVLEVAQLELYLPECSGGIGCPLKSRSAMARAFTAKAVYHLPTTEALLDRLESDTKLRRLCGWEKARDVPSRTTFSRAFNEFAEAGLTERVHEGIIQSHMAGQLVGHISRDSTAIVAREKPVSKTASEKEAPAIEPKKRGRPKKGEERVKIPTRLERQSRGMSVAEMKADLPIDCTVGAKRNSQGYKSSWIGYKLHIDSADGGIPVSCLLSSASLHDSQVAIPLATITAGRVESCYDLMDSAYDAPLIKRHSESLGHRPIIDTNPRTKAGKELIEEENKSRRHAQFQPAEAIRYHERSTVERVNGRMNNPAASSGVSKDRKLSGFM